MAPFIVFTVTTLAALLSGTAGLTYAEGLPQALAIGLAAMLALTSGAHFHPTRRQGLIAIVPPRLPFPDHLVTLTGILEILAAVGLLVPPTFLDWARPSASFCLTLLLIIMFPANVFAATEKRGKDSPDTPLLPRTLLQVLFVSAALIVGIASL